MTEITNENKLEFDRLCNKVMSKSDAVGVAASFFDRDGNILYEKFYGLRDKNKNLPIDENTIFGLASVTKSFVTLCCLKLADEGKISLDDPLSKYFPSFTGKNMKVPLKLWHLLCHSGGFYPLHRYVVYAVADMLGIDEKTEGDFSLSVKLAEEGAKLVASQMDDITDHIGLPGEKMSYCNDGFGLLSEVVRIASGEKTFYDYLRKNILEPLSMDRTTVEFIKPAEDENSSMLYYKENGELVESHDYRHHSFVLNGAGMLKSTIKDMRNYICMYLNEGRNKKGSRVMPYRLLEEMEKPRQAMNPDNYYCYGISMKKLEGYNMFGHSGGLPGVSSYIAFIPDLGIGGVVLCNTSNSSMGSLCEAGMRLAMGEKPAFTHHYYKEIRWDEEFLNDVCGFYESKEEGGYEILEAGGKLILRENDHDTHLIPVFPDVAVAHKEFGDAYLKVLKDDEGRVYASRYGSRVLKKKR